MDFYQPKAFAEMQTPNKDLVRGLLSDLLAAGIIPDETRRWGITIHVAEEMRDELGKATEEQCKKGIELARVRLCTSKN